MIHIELVSGHKFSVDTTLEDFQTKVWRPARSGDHLMRVEATNGTFMMPVESVAVISGD